MKRLPHRRSALGALPLGLLLALLLSAAPLLHAGAEEAAWAVNSSGSQNVTLAVDPVVNGEGYSAILYDNRNGLPTSEANAIAQTDDGFIWIGSYAGLIRYDGSTFERVESDEGILNTRCLYVDRQGRLWIGTNDFGVFLMENYQIHRVDREDELLSVSVRSIAEDTDGLIYVATAAGVAMVDANLRLRMVNDARLRAITVQELRAGPDGLMLAVTQSGDLFGMKGGQVETCLSHEESGLESILAVLPDPLRPGSVYLATENAAAKSAQICHGALADPFVPDQVVDAAPLSYVERMECIDGHVWICAGNGIGKLDEQGVHLLKNVPMEKSVGHVMTDYMGNMWFTSTRQCVMKVVPNRFLDYFEQNGLAADVVNSTCFLDDLLFIATDDSGLMVVQNGRALDSLPLKSAATASGKELAADDLLDYLREERIRSVVRDSRHRVWISTWRHQNGLLCYDDGALTVYTREDGLLSDQVRVVSECADGAILAAQPDGVSLIRNQKVEASWGAGEGILVTSVLTLTEGFQNEIILGTDGGGIYIIGEDGLRHIGLTDGLKSEVILRIKRSRHHNLYWIATGNSIAYMTPDYQVTTVDHFPYSNNYDFYENSQGDLWVLSSNGIYVVSTEDMLDGGTVDSVFYGIPGGLPFIATSNSYSELTEEGRLYIAGVQGVVRVNIDQPETRISEVKVSLPYADADGTRLYPDDEGGFVVPYNTRRLTLYPYVFNYSLMDPQVSFRLRGFDQEAVVISRSQLTPVSYTNLNAGDYAFEMQVDDPMFSQRLEVSFPIVKQKMISDGATGTIILDFTAMLLLFGLMVNTSMYRRRGRLEDRLFSAMLTVILIHAFAEFASILLESSQHAVAFAALHAANLLVYAAIESFLYLFLLYFDYQLHPDAQRFNRRMLIYAIPLMMYAVLLLVNLGTGWLYAITGENHRQQGFLYPVIYGLGFVYLVLAFIRVGRLSHRMLAVCAIIVLTRMAWYIWSPEELSAAFVDTLLLICAHIQMIQQTSQKEGAP